MQYQLKKEATVEIIEKKSRFITRIRSISSEDDVSVVLKEISKIEKQATHHCYAFRLLGKNGIIERKNDDGEPGGTAGAPMLAVLTGENLINVLAVTSRYFGGIKLGSGGLVNAYKHGVVEAVKASGKEEFKIFNNRILTFPIRETHHAEYLLLKADIKIIEKQFLENVIFIVSIDEQKNELLKNIAKQVNGAVLNQ